MCICICIVIYMHVYVLLLALAASWPELQHWVMGLPNHSTWKSRKGKDDTSFISSSRSHSPGMTFLLVYCWWAPSQKTAATLLPLFTWLMVLMLSLVLLLSVMLLSLLLRVVVVVVAVSVVLLLLLLFLGLLPLAIRVWPWCCWWSCSGAADMDSSREGTPNRPSPRMTHPPPSIVIPC